MTVIRRLALVGIVAAITTSAWGFTPDSNVTRGIYVHYRNMLPLMVWEKWGSGYTHVQENPHSGDFCIKAVGEAGTKGQGAGQQVQFNQEKPAPIKIAGWSRCENVEVAESGYRYSVYVDMSYTDGTSWPMQVAAFSPGTHDWEYSEVIVEPEKPVASARVWAFIRDIGGTVWFDDLFIGPADGENLLKTPGFEKVTGPDLSPREEVFDTYEALHANAIHTYTALPQDEDAAELLRETLAAARERGMGVVVTPHATGVGIDNIDDPDFPQYVCVLGEWADRWVAALEGYAKYDFMGISLVPDEYNWTNGRLKASYEKHPDEAVREFYAALPTYCNCPVCQERFEEWYGEPLPDLGQWWRAPDQTDVSRKFVDFRYRATAEWIARGAAAVRATNPEIRTDSLICVSPICSDFRLGTGVAWDMMGYASGIDFPTTDPYILLHNYKGDSTHWYVTETTAHLVGSTPKRQAGIVIESSRLRAEHRPLDPVEIYGSALSAVSRNAKELAWWHYVHITGASGANQGEVSYSSVRGAYDLLERVDPWLDGAAPEKRVALLYSRASEEWFSFYTSPEPNAILTHQTEDLRYAFLAQKEVLYYLFRAGVPTDLFFLDQVSAEELADYPVIVVPFAFAAGEAQAALLQGLAEAGKQVLIVSEFGTVDELGAPLETPALLELCGLAQAPTGEKEGVLAFNGGPVSLTGNTYAGVRVYDSVRPARPSYVEATVDGTPAILSHQVGAGRVVFLAGEFGLGLAANTDNERQGREERVWPAELSGAHTAVMAGLLDDMYGAPVSLIRQAPTGKDIEIAAMRNAAGEIVLFAINWESDTQQCQVALPEGSGSMGEGFALNAQGAVAPMAASADGDGTLALALEGQQAVVLRMR